MNKKFLLGFVIVVFAVYYILYGRPKDKSVELPDFYDRDKITMVTDIVMNSLIEKDYEKIAEYGEKTFNEKILSKNTENLSEVITKSGKFKGYNIEDIRAMANDKKELLAMPIIKSEFEEREIEFKLFFNKEYKLVAIYAQ